MQPRPGETRFQAANDAQGAEDLRIGPWLISRPHAGRRVFVRRIRMHAFGAPGRRGGESQILTSRHLHYAPSGRVIAPGEQYKPSAREGDGFIFRLRINE